MTRNERFWLWFAWLLPKTLVYWCLIRAGAYASTGKYGTDHPDMPFFTVLDRWHKQ